MSHADVILATSLVRRLSSGMALILTNAGPSIDGDLIPDSPHSLLEQGAFAPIPFISGNNADE
jgi:hypothetical protein